ncbi:MAG TPA: heme exporter protein CcmD [Alphaproteobacteria bacterium]|nr:heme exporter protein CcmD [Alphaproteobacteria bacterium]
MDKIASFLEMGGYADFVWPAFGIALAVLAGFLVTSLRTLRSREATLRTLEAAAPESPRRRRARLAEPNSSTVPGENAKV